MLMKIERYTYTPTDLGTLRRGDGLDLTPFGYRRLSLRQYVRMRKSLRLYAELEKAQGAPAGIKPEHRAKAARKYPAGSRWITVHPNNSARGVPVLIKDHGDGTAHVIAGAGGRLNMLKLNKIKSPQEYKAAVQQRREQEKQEKEAEREQERKFKQTLTKEERKAYVEKQKEERQARAEEARSIEEQQQKVEEQFIEEIQDVLGWEVEPIEDNFTAMRENLQETLAAAVDQEDAAQIKRVKRELELVDKAEARAEKSQRKNVIAQAKDIVKRFQQDLINDEELREAVEAQIGGEAGAEERIRREKKGTGKGFETEYRQSAEEAGLTAPELSQEKRETFDRRMEEIAEEIGESTANMIRAGLKTNREINELKRDGYAEKETYERKITDTDTKVDTLRKYLEMRKRMEALQGEERPDITLVQQTLEGRPEDEVAQSVREIRYGNGVKIDTEVTAEDFARSLMAAEEQLKAERQAALNSSMLEKITANPNGVQKWIANGNYNGFNSIALSVLKTEGLDRDTVDLLGVGNSAVLLANLIRDTVGEQELEDIAKAMEFYHEEINETVVQEALDRGETLLTRVESIELDIANNPEDLAVLQELNEARLQYLDEANRVLGQALGSLEASAAMANAMKSPGDLEKIDTNLGKIGNEEAIVRTRALGLEKDEYFINTIDGNKVVEIGRAGMDKLVKQVDPKEVELQNRVDAIKAGAEDEPGWLPAGIISRPESTFTDPGPDTTLSSTHIDRQEIPQTDGTSEAIHRSLGAIPEGAFAFKQMEDLTPQEMTDLRRYWEQSIYQGSMAEATSAREYATGKGKSRAGLWGSFLRENAGSKEAAFEVIKNDLIENHASEDMFGMKDIPPIAKVRAGDWESYRGNVTGASEYFREIDDLGSDLQAGRVTDEGGARRKLDTLRGQLPEKLSELYDEQMRDHYLKHLSGATEEELEAGAAREERTPWGEYVRMHGDVRRAQEAILDRVRGDFVTEYAKNHGRVHGQPLKTGTQTIRNHQDHVLGMLPREERDSVINKVQAELASAGATVAERVHGKFARGSWKEKALEEIERRRGEASQQTGLFGEEEVKQDDGTEVVTIGKRAEKQLAGLIPNVAANFRRGQKVTVFPDLTMSSEKHVQQQRAIKVFEHAKRMNLTFGTGKGKSITSIGAFTHLKAKGKVKRALFAVPSVVQAQFGGEALKYTKPNAYRWSAEPGMTREARIGALKDGNLDMVVVTHQSLRDDLVYLMGRRLGKSPEDTKRTFNGMSEEARRNLLREALEKEGIDFQMLVVDESHYTVKRKGKKDSTLSNIMDALNQGTEYFMNQSATPVKNDVSEAWDMLKKVDPGRFGNRSEFMKKYGVDTVHSKEALRRLIGRYNYASPTVTGVKRTSKRETVQLTAGQKKAYQEVEDAFKRASKAVRSGAVDVDAMRLLSPTSFRNLPESKHEEVARQLQQSAGVIKEEALNRVVNQHDRQDNAKIQKVLDVVSEKYYREDHRSGAKAGDMQPGVIFAHNIRSIERLRDALQSKGLRVGVIQGSMNGNEKEAVKNAFHTRHPRERKYDVLLCSDAGATGLNLQNAKYLVNYDLPHTSWVKEQREGRIDRHGQAHDEIEYHDIVTDTPHEATKWARIQRKAELGSVFQQDPGVLDDTGLAERVARVRQERESQGRKVA